MNRDQIADKFLDVIPFDPYPFQEEALLAWFGENEGILVSAPTGMGKTLVAEAAIFEALHSGKRMFYTTPLIALTDQKFREFQHRAVDWGFHPDDVGLITGNRKINPQARVQVVVAEILLNHLLSPDEPFGDVDSVVMDEFHYFHDLDRGIVWELSLVLLPKTTRVMLLSATVGNAREFCGWLRTSHGRSLQLVTTEERRVPLEFHWVGEKLLTELLPDMIGSDDASARVPALVFCFNRDECWDVAERIKGLPLISANTRAEIEKLLPPDDFVEGVGPKLKQMLIRGVGVHHAGVLPKHKETIETLFLRKLIPFVICTETLAAGINLPARSVVLSTLLKGKPGERTLIPPGAAHQMFGRAGRPQFDSKGYVYAVAHDDDVKIAKWKKKYEQIDPNSKDPGIMRMRKQLERKRPSRRSTEQYWVEGQFQSLIKAGPGRLASRAMIPYTVLIYLLRKSGALNDVREFLSKRFNSEERVNSFKEQLEHMIDNMAALGYLAKSEDGDYVTLDGSVERLSVFRSIDPLYGRYLSGHLSHASFDEKVQVLESVLPMPPGLSRRMRIPEDKQQGPLERDVIRPLLLQLGLLAAEMPAPQGDADEAESREGKGWWDEEPEERPPTFPEMLKLAFDAKLPTPEEILIDPKWVAGGTFDFDCDFYKFVRARDMIKQEGLILRHLLRLVILSGEFYEVTEDPEYKQISEMATKTCNRVDPIYTDRFLAEASEVKKLL